MHSEDLDMTEQEYIGLWFEDSEVAEDGQGEN